MCNELRKEVIHANMYMIKLIIAAKMVISPDEAIKNEFKFRANYKISTAQHQTNGRTQTGQQIANENSKDDDLMEKISRMVTEKVNNTTSHIEEKLRNYSDSNDLAIKSLKEKTDNIDRGLSELKSDFKSIMAENMKNITEQNKEILNTVQRFIKDGNPEAVNCRNNFPITHNKAFGRNRANNEHIVDPPVHKLVNASNYRTQTTHNIHNNNSLKYNSTGYVNSNQDSDDEYWGGEISTS